jgi:DNA replication licensing factor MCM6
VDYWIAQRIVNFHTSDAQVVERARVYSVADIHKYITFARLCKPKISAEAQQVMIAEYKRLRQRESSSRSAWRITVRQLESMIRLSEALARMHLSEQVTEAHVHEAFRLLSKSIIRVEQPDVQLEESALEEAHLPMESVGAHETQQTTTQTTEASQAPHEPVSAAKQTVRLSYDEYKRISNMVVYYIRKKEEEIDSESKSFLFFV